MEIARHFSDAKRSLSCTGPGKHSDPETSLQPVSHTAQTLAWSRPSWWEKIKPRAHTSQLCPQASDYTYLVIFPTLDMDTAIAF